MTSLDNFKLVAPTLAVYTVRQLTEELQELDYSERLQWLGLWPLEKRRNRADLNEVFKIVLVYPPCLYQHFYRAACNADAVL